MLNKSHQNISLYDIYGPWYLTGPQKGLVERIEKAWAKPLAELTNAEMAALLRQKFAMEYVLPLIRQRLIEEYSDSTELFEDELQKMVDIIDLGEE